MDEEDNESDSCESSIDSWPNNTIDGDTNTLLKYQFIIIKLILALTSFSVKSINYYLINYMDVNQVQI